MKKYNLLILFIIFMLVLPGCDILNKKEVQAINVTKAQIELKVGDTYKIEYEVIPSDARNVKIEFSTYSNSSTEVISISDDGTITALRKGSTNIIVKNSSNGVSGSAVVIVNEKEVSHTHTFSSNWSNDELYHWHAATCEHISEIKDKGVHVFGEGAVINEPISTKEGLTRYTCSVCGYKKDVVVPIVGSYISINKDLVSSNLSITKGSVYIDQNTTVKLNNYDFIFYTDIGFANAKYAQGMNSLKAFQLRSGKASVTTGITNDTIIECIDKIVITQLSCDSIAMLNPVKVFYGTSKNPYVNEITPTLGSSVETNVVYGDSGNDTGYINEKIKRTEITYIFNDFYGYFSINGGQGVSYIEDIKIYTKEGTAKIDDPSTGGGGSDPIIIGDSSYMDQYNALSQSVKSYYSSIINNINITNLRSTISTGFKQQSYKSLNTSLAKSDVDPKNSKNLILFYTRMSVDGSWDSASTWNKEHVWPQSLGGFGTSGAGADIAHIRPSDPTANSKRGNLQYADLSKNGTKVIGKNSQLAGYSNGSYFEPLDNCKGDVARIIFYLITRYSDLNARFNQSSNSPVRNCDIELLLKWNELDPVDSLEVTRNNVTEQIQGNRNPFIDMPALANSLFKK